MCRKWMENQNIFTIEIICGCCIANLTSAHLTKQKKVNISRVKDQLKTALDLAYPHSDIKPTKPRVIA